MPRRKPSTVAPNLKFDYARLREYIKEAGGINRVSKRAGISKQAFYQLVERNPPPLPLTIIKIITELKLPLSVIRALFIEGESP